MHRISKRVCDGKSVKTLFSNLKSHPMNFEIIVSDNTKKDIKYYLLKIYKFNLER